ADIVDTRVVDARLVVHVRAARDRQVGVLEQRKGRLLQRTLGEDESEHDGRRYRVASEWNEAIGPSRLRSRPIRRPCSRGPRPRALQQSLGDDIVEAAARDGDSQTFAVELRATASGGELPLILRGHRRGRRAGGPCAPAWCGGSGCSRGWASTRAARDR